MILSESEWPDLPKWPEAFVSGKSVTPEQAKEIIFHTDTNLQGGPTNFLHGNDKQFKDRVLQEFGWTEYLKLSESWWKADTAEARASMLPQNCEYGDIWDIADAWRKEMNIICTEYVSNTYLTSAYVGGPTGWVHPDGSISVRGHNYGKWPSVGAIVQDWKLLLNEFPYLDLVCTLFNGEYCDKHTVPLCTILVRNGDVLVTEPNLLEHSKFDDSPYSSNILDDGMAHINRLMRGDYSCERGWPEPWIEEFGIKSREAMRKVMPWV